MSMLRTVESKIRINSSCQLQYGNVQVEQRLTRPEERRDPKTKISAVVASCYSRYY